MDAVSNSNTPSVEIEKIKIADCLHSVMDSINNLVSASRINITTDFSKQPYLYFNRSYLESILLNLITNSIKYSKSGSIPHLKIVSKDYPDKTEMIFEDNGMGFDMGKVKDKNFGLHQTFHHNEDSKGIGLYLVHTHVTSLGGKVSVESEVGKGTKFTITFNKELR
jgi:signal transduction histidine kinase